MSAPTPAPGDDRPREGYYPDPSIPGYVRYWNGAAWVPGTSRPAPVDGEPLSPPPGVRPAPAAPAAPAVEETGPHFFDEDPIGAPGPAGGPAQPPAAWAADPARQSGYGGERDQHVSWTAPAAADPRLAHTVEPPGRRPEIPAAGSGGDAQPPGTADQGRGQGQGQGQVPVQGHGHGQGQPESGSTFVFRRPAAGDGPAAGVPGPGGPADEGTMTFRPVDRRERGGGPAGAAPGRPSVPAQGTSAPGGFGPGPGSGHGSGPGFGAGKAAAARASAAPSPAPAPAPGPPPGPAQGPASAPAPAPAPVAPSLPQQSGLPQPAAAPGPLPTPLTSGPGGGQASWAQQVHQLAGAGGGASAGTGAAGADGQPVAPWKPPVEDPFQALARRQAAARPAGIGKRLAARLVDTVVLGAVTAAAAVPLGARAVDHVDEKIDTAKLSGRTVTVWLLDGTTAAYLGIVVAVLLVFGVLYEALPTARWGRTLGKKLCGLQVRDIEGHEPPSFGPALRRWLVYSVPGLLGVGVVGVLWCLFDRPWHQCWHDKAAHTFVAG
ncbi:RDD family protein [Streptomyces sp. NPDC047017]|uniref:RDD family protein n=1 Tax=Streptomyces sp. NPDC047017 TaxID=3155024 RepID=UPI0033D80E25